MGFAGAGWPEQVDDLGTVDEVEAGERHDPVAVERGLEREVEAESVLTMGSLAMRNAALIRRFSRKLSSSVSRLLIPGKVPGIPG